MLLLFFFLQFNKHGIRNMSNGHFNTGSSQTPTYYEHLLMTSNLLSISGLLGGSSGGLAPSGRETVEKNFS